MICRPFSRPSRLQRPVGVRATAVPTAPPPQIATYTAANGAAAKPQDAAQVVRRYDNDGSRAMLTSAPMNLYACVDVDIDRGSLLRFEFHLYIDSM